MGQGSPSRWKPILSQSDNYIAPLKKGSYTTISLLSLKNRIWNIYPRNAKNEVVAFFGECVCEIDVRENEGGKVKTIKCPLFAQIGKCSKGTYFIREVAGGCVKTKEVFRILKVFLDKECQLQRLKNVYQSWGSKFTSLRKEEIMDIKRALHDLMAEWKKELSCIEGKEQTVLISLLQTIIDFNNKDRTDILKTITALSYYTLCCLYVTEAIDLGCKHKSDSYVSIEANYQYVKDCLSQLPNNIQSFLNNSKPRMIAEAIRQNNEELKNAEVAEITNVVKEDEKTEVGENRLLDIRYEIEVLLNRISLDLKLSKLYDAAQKRYDSILGEGYPIPIVVAVLTNFKNQLQSTIDNILNNEYTK